MNNRTKIKTLREKIVQLKNNIRYENRKLNICAYGKSDLLYIQSLQIELAEAKAELKKLEDMHE
jgi:hypothetical protein